MRGPRSRDAISIDQTELLTPVSRPLLVLIYTEYHDYVPEVAWTKCTEKVVAHHVFDWDPPLRRYAFHPLHLWKSPVILATCPSKSFRNIKP